jgi:ABC-2 type transport system permease protein
LSSKFLIPALIGFILMIVSVIMTSLSIVREKEKNTIEQIIVSPIKPYELILGKILTNIVLALLISLFIFIGAYFLFGLEIKGDILLLFISILIFLSCSLGMGIMISTVAETQQVAFMISVIITMLPSFILSGFVFPIRNMPVVIQLVTYVIPARYFLVILRSIVIKGTGIASFWQEILSLAVLSAILLAMSIKRLSKKNI